MSFPHDRAEPRYTPRSDAPIFVDIMGASFFDRFRAKDISKNGVSIYVPHDFQGCDISHEIDLIITMPDKRSFKARGLIRHKGTGQAHFYGVKLVKVEDKAHAIIEAYIRTLAPAA